MELLLCVTVGVLYAAGFYLMMRRSIVKLIVGLVLLGHATNLLIFCAGRLVMAKAPFAGQVAARLGEVDDPLPQALILTAIVISFGVQAFAIILIKRYWRSASTEDMEQMRSTEQLES